MTHVPFQIPARFRRWAAAGALAATLVAAGAVPALAESSSPATVPGPTQAAASAHHARRGHHLRQLGKYLGGYLGLSAEQVGDLVKQYGPRKLVVAAPLAKLSQRPVAEVIALKTDGNTWKDVAETLRLSPEQVRAEAENMWVALREAAKQDAAAQLATALAGYLEAPAGDVQQLILQKGARTVLAAAPLAKLSRKPVADVIALKTADNEWKDVAETLGLTPEQVRTEMKKLHAALKKLRAAPRPARER